ncbi:MAG: (d)CMP kinase [Planctomycetota bacterium]|nr:(d)CMP kinase [Planctomycetota bacterium]
MAHDARRAADEAMLVEGLDAPPVDARVVQGDAVESNQMNSIEAAGGLATIDADASNLDASNLAGDARRSRVVSRTVGIVTGAMGARAAFTVRRDRWKLDVLATDRPIVITIDGPAGTGKSTVARALAKRLGLDFLDTGAMYRAAAAIAIDHAIDLKDHATIVTKVGHADLHFDWSQDPPVMLASGKPIQHRLRDPDVTRVVSPIAGIKPLRELMVRKQRIIAHQHPRLVSEGRDQGSVVFPDAAVKFYLHASPEVRGKRRYDQLIAAGQNADLEKLIAEIIDRDHSDSTRSDGPLICPDDATVVDTSNLEFAEVVSLLEQEVYDRVGV